MILCLDVGNSQIFGGVFNAEKLGTTFRKTSKAGSSSDEFGLFLRSVLRENQIDPDLIEQIAICSVVPEVVHSLRNACLKYFNVTPFLLQPGIRTGLKIRYRNPVEVGADRIANAIAATSLYPNKNLIVIDFGTASTFDAITKDRDYLGGIITAGIRISMEALEMKTAKLPTVEIVEPETVIGRSTIENIQSGLFHGSLAMIEGLVQRISSEAFPNEKPLVIGTGGFARLFEKSKTFDVVLPNLVLTGVYQALKMSQETGNLRNMQ
jgi:type III pantothenate kinase